MHPVVMTLQKEKMLAVLRTPEPDQALWAGRVLIETGIQCLEIPCTVPETAQVIQTLNQEFPEACIGAGTVLSIDQGEAVLAAGARFLVSPIWDPVLLVWSQKKRVQQNSAPNNADLKIAPNNVDNPERKTIEGMPLFIPGCMTPTELYQAGQAGAEVLKFFPANSAGGPGFLEALKGPFPNLPILATGGISLTDMPAYLAAGALAVGLGAPLLPKKILVARDVSALKSLAQQALSLRSMN